MCQLQNRHHNKHGLKYAPNISILVFHSFPNLEQNVRDPVDKIKPFLPKDIPVYVFIYNVKTGKLAREG